MRTFLTAALAVAALPAFTGTANAQWLWPLRGQVITPYRNVDDPYAGGQHRGIDIAGQVGARVVAAAGGEVRFAGTAGSSGLTVSVRTTDAFDTSYLHLSSVAVREGQFVSAGDALGAVGVTGSRSASEPHLHFGVREAGTRHAYRNPLDLLPPPQAPPTPEAPHPAPEPVPTSPAPAPAPAGQGGPRRVPVGEPTPRRIPAGGRAPRRVPADRRAPRRVPADGLSRRRVPAAEPSPGRLPVGGEARRRVGIPADVPAPRSAPVPEHAPRPLLTGEGAPRRLPLGGHAARRLDAPESLRVGPSPGPAPAAPPATEKRHSSPDKATTPWGSAAHGPDVGWILACVGLLLATALLGLTEDGRKASRTGRGHLARLLRPLTGRG
jgi:hypothetical protein